MINIMLDLNTTSSVLTRRGRIGGEGYERLEVENIIVPFGVPLSFWRTSFCIWERVGCFRCRSRRRAFSRWSPGLL